MALLRKGQLFLPTFCQVRHRGKINIQKPRVDKLPRRLFESLMVPILKPVKKVPAEICAAKREERLQVEKEVNGYEEFLFRRCQKMFETKKMIAVCQALPMNSRDYYKIKNAVLNNGMEHVIYNNSIMRRAVTDTKYENMLPLFQGANSYVVSDDIMFKELMKVTRKIPQLVVLSVLADNCILSREAVIRLARLPGIHYLHGELTALLGHGAMKTHSLLGSHQQMLSVNLEQYVKQNTPGVDREISKNTQDIEISTSES